MNRFKQFLRHLTTTTGTGRRLFPEATLQAIEQVIEEGERRHRAEVHMVIEPALPLGQVWDGAAMRDRARELFSDYRVWDTEENCGVLVYVNIAEHQVEIVADRGIGRLVSQDEWQRVCDFMTRGFAQGAYHDGVLQALRELNALLEKYVGATESGTNQLSNRPVIL